VKWQLLREDGAMGLMSATGVSALVIELKFVGERGTETPRRSSV